MGKTDFNTRIICIEKEIIGSRNEKVTMGLLDKTKEPFSVRMKPFWDIVTARKVCKLVSYQIRISFRSFDKMLSFQ